MELKLAKINGANLRVVESERPRKAGGLTDVSSPKGCQIEPMGEIGSSLKGCQKSPPKNYRFHHDHCHPTALGS